MSVQARHHTQAERSGITPRRPLRRTMTPLQASEDSDEGKERESSCPSWVSVWVSAAAWPTQYLHASFSSRVAYTLTTLLALSAIHCCVDLPHLQGITGKHSILNQVFAKKAWGITLAVFVPYCAVSLLIQPNFLVGLKQLGVRSAVTTLFFFLSCQGLFPAVDKLTATCIAGNETLALTKAECLSDKGREYVSFDISGHSFLLTYCVFIMMEESKEIKYFLWLGRRLFGEVVREKEDATWPELDDKQARSLRRWFPKVSPLVAVTFLNMSALTLLWDFMLIVTTLYYHSFAEKVIGTVLALLTWGFLYRLAFPWLFALKALRS